jgi:hypothetical protein
MPSPDEVRRLAARGASRGLAEIALKVLEAAKHGVPVGDPDVDPDPMVTLRESGRIEIEHGGRTALIVFDTPYAAKIHEDLHLHHPRGGGAKYLEGPTLQALPLLEGAIASEVRKNMKAG